MQLFGVTVLQSLQVYLNFDTKLQKKSRIAKGNGIMG